jgi:Subtilase family
MIALIVGLMISIPDTGSADVDLRGPEERPEIPEHLEAVAKELVAEREGRPVEDLTIIAAAPLNFTELGMRIYEYKIAGLEDGMTFGLALDEGGNPVEAEFLEEEDNHLRFERYGWIDPRLFRELTLVRDEPVRSWVWLKVHPELSPVSLLPLPSDTEGENSNEEIDDRLHEIRRENRMRNIEVVEPFLEMMATRGIKAKASKVAPVVFIKCGVETLFELGFDEELGDVIDVIQRDTTTYRPLLNKVKQCVFGGYGPPNRFPKNQYYSPYNGFNVQVAVVDDYGRLPDHTYQYLGTNQHAQFPVTIDSKYHQLHYQCFPGYICLKPIVPDHPTIVSQVIRGTHNKYGGAATNVRLWAGCGMNDTEVRNRIQKAALWGANLINLSFGDIEIEEWYCDWYEDAGRVCEPIVPPPDGFSRFCDSISRNYNVSIVCAAGDSRGEWYDEDVTYANEFLVWNPANGYNVIGVGAYDQYSTPINYVKYYETDYSASMAPASAHGDRKKPEITAPGTAVVPNPFTNLGYQAKGTSVSAPVVSGGLATLMEANKTVKDFPQLAKALLLASAIDKLSIGSKFPNYIGNNKGVRFDEAFRMLNHKKGICGTQLITTPSSGGTHKRLYEVVKLRLGKGEGCRVAIAWLTDTNYSGYEKRASVDIDLKIYFNDKQYADKGKLAVSAGYDDTHEVVEFQANEDGWYTLVLDVFKWHHYSLPSAKVAVGFAWTETSTNTDHRICHPEEGTTMYDLGGGTTFFPDTNVCYTKNIHW